MRRRDEEELNDKCGRRRYLESLESIYSSA
jgi:hypothetical protein